MSVAGGGSKTSTYRPSSAPSVGSTTNRLSTRASGSPAKTTRSTRYTSSSNASAPHSTVANSATRCGVTVQRSRSKATGRVERPLRNAATSLGREAGTTAHARPGPTQRDPEPAGHAYLRGSRGGRRHPADLPRVRRAWLFRISNRGRPQLGWDLVASGKAIEGHVRYNPAACGLSGPNNLFAPRALNCRSKRL